MLRAGLRDDPASDSTHEFRVLVPISVSSQRLLQLRHGHRWYFDSWARWRTTEHLRQALGDCLNEYRVLNRANPSSNAEDVKLGLGLTHLLRIYLVYSSLRSDKQTRISFPSSTIAPAYIYIGSVPKTSLYSPLPSRGRALRSRRSYSSKWR
jgi:hypothetical protein